MGKEYANFGLISAVLSLFIVPEIFGSAAIILGAYAWKRELGNSNRGLSVLVLGIICMLIGIYFTSLFELGDLIPAF
jgi:membrane-bound ClpP family serine protease